MEGNTPLWDAIAARHNSIFRILYHCLSISDPHTAGDLLCMAAKRNDLSTMKELLTHGLNVDSKNRDNFTALQIAMADNNVDMVSLLVLNGAKIENVDQTGFSSVILDEMVQKREVGHRITMHEAVVDHTQRVFLKRKQEDQKLKLKLGKSSDGGCIKRVSIYRGHPVVRRNTGCKQTGWLIRFPGSMVELKTIAGNKFGFDASNAVITNEEGAEIDSIEVIRDDDKVYIVEDVNLVFN